MSVLIAVSLLQHADFVIRSSREELRDFFDQFLKGKDNQFMEKSPKCQWTLLRFGDKEPIQRITIPDYPHPNTEYKEMFLNSGGQLTSQSQDAVDSVSYNSEQKEDMVEFKYTFDKPTTLLGIPKAYLHMSCKEWDDMNVYVQLRKYDKDGVVLAHINVPAERRKFPSYYTTPKSELAGLIAFTGPIGMLRASHRNIDRSKTYHPQIPFHPHDREDKIPPGEIVELEIGIFEMGILYEAGETLSVQIYGQANINDITPDKRSLSRERPDHERNHGTHVVHIGGKYPSRIILPFVDLGMPELFGRD